jgi:hypothetical protein
VDPPFGGRNGHVPWLRRFLDHGDGIAIVRAYTSSAWFHRYAIHAETMLFPKGKTKFIRPNCSVGRSPGHGVVLLGVGEVANDALRNSGLGFLVGAGGARKVECRSQAFVFSCGIEARNVSNDFPTLPVIARSTLREIVR